MTQLRHSYHLNCHTYCTLMLHEIEITLPEEVPVMTLPQMAFFPQALIPLHIFEPRYRAMLSDVLKTNRLFALVGLNTQVVTDEERNEPPCSIGCVGLVRSSKENQNGTSDLMLQGLCRVEIRSIVREEPYRVVKIKPLISKPAGAGVDLNFKRAELGKLIAIKHKLLFQNDKALAQYLKTIEDPETFIDLAAFTLCDNPEFKQKLLETLELSERYELYSDRLRLDVALLRLEKKLQGGTSTDKIADN